MSVPGYCVLRNGARRAGTISELRRVVIKIYVYIYTRIRWPRVYGGGA